MPVATDLGQELGMFRDQVKRLKERAEQLRFCDTELTTAKRQAEDSIRHVAKTKEIWDTKIALEQRDFAIKQKEDAERIARYEKKAAEDAQRIAALEQEIASLRKRAEADSESLASLLGRLSLSQHLATLEEEELDVMLLRSMGREVLSTNMAEVGLTEAEIARLSSALFAAGGSVVGQP